MADKSKVMSLLQKDWQKYWKVDFFKSEEWDRHKCPTCGKYYWSIEEKQNCGDPPCGQYEFIGKPIGKKMDLIESWKAIEKFFVENDHTSIESYPVICRWFPGLYFTVASIVDFMRESGGQTTFEMPELPLIVPQACMRFNDIPSVGVSGRHMTAFTMVGQHTLSPPSYWKHECAKLNYELLTQVFKIDEKEITWHEDVWVGPAAFGYSLEYFVRGLELGNCVFTEFLGTPNSYKTMNPKVIDMGAGLERFAWVTQGTATAYDAVYGPVMKKLKKHVDYDEKAFMEYAKKTGSLNADERDLEKERAKLGGKQYAELEALYAIADHAKALTMAITDGGIPSNVGGGYNLRVVSRRAFDLIQKHGFNIELGDVCEQHAKYLKPIYPKLIESIDSVQEIIEVEKRKHKVARFKAKGTVEKLLEKKTKFSEKEMALLYESQGISPELVKDVAEEMEKKVDIPDIYAKMTEKHVRAEKEKAVVEVNAPDTTPLWHDDTKEFDANVLKNIEWQGKNWVVLDRSAFYAEGGGQGHDTGFINDERVNDVQRVKSVVLHQVDKTLSGKVHAELDWARRRQLMQHHTATHCVNGAARRVLGKHVWQGGAEKTVRKAHLDITHYDALTEDQENKIEELANKVVKEARPVTSAVMPREKAEKKYGFRLYQGGAVPEKELRIVNVKDWDVEACGGTHVNNTEGVQKIVLLNSEKVQDGLVRLTYVAGEAADDALQKMEEDVKELEKLLGVKRKQVPNAVAKLLGEWKEKKKQVELLEKQRAGKELACMEFTKHGGFEFVMQKYKGDMKFLRSISKGCCNERRFLFLVGITDRIYVFCFAGEEYTKQGIHAGNIVRELCSKLGGGGGGPAERGEGVIPLSQKAKVDQLFKAVEKRLEASVWKNS